MHLYDPRLLIFLLLAGLLPVRLMAQSDTLLVGAEMGYPPYSVVNERGEVEGFSIDLFRAAAEAVGKKVKFIVAPWSELEADLTAGKIQAIPFVVRSTERESVFDFSVPYLTMHAAIMVNDRDSAVRSLNDLKGKKIALAAGGFSELLLRSMNQKSTLVPVPTLEDALKLLSNNQCDAVMGQKLVAVSLISKLELKHLITIDMQLDSFEQHFCFGLADGNSTLMNLLNEGLTIIFANGTFRKIRDRWFAPTGDVEYDRSRIVIGGDYDYPPYEFLDENGQPAGFNVDLIKGIAREMGISINIQLRQWSEVRKSLDENRIDAITGMFYSIERGVLFDFSPPHSLVSQVFVFRRMDEEPVSLSQLQNRSVVVQEGDIMHDLILKRGNPRELILAKTQVEALQMVAAGKSDCALVSRTQAFYYIDVHHLKNLKVSDKPVMSAEYCFAVSEGNRAVLDLLNEGLTTLKATGEYRKIYSRWLGVFDPPKVNFWEVLKYFSYVLIPLLLLLALALSWSSTLQHRVAKRTAKLQESESQLRKTNIELEAAKVKAEESDRLKSSFLANMSHEIRTPMNGILGFAELLEDPHLEDEEQKKYVAIIQQSGERMLALINDLIDISKIEAGQVQLNIQEVQPQSLLTDLFAFFLPEAEKKGLSLCLDNPLEHHHKLIFTDKSKLQQVLVNLIKNAIKFTFQGKISFGFNHLPEGIEFVVTDTGVGISPENQKRIFDRFSRGSSTRLREVEGAGLGLSISKAYVEMLGGQILLVSEPGQGSTFSFVIPHRFNS